MTKTSQQFVYLLIHTWAPVIDKQNWVMQKAYMSVLDDEIEQLTPRQFAQIFPITKEYKAANMETKITTQLLTGSWKILAGITEFLMALSS